MRDGLVAQLDALGEDEFYYSPATTKAKINEAIACIEAQAARIAKLEAGLKEIRFMTTEADGAARAEALIDELLAGGKDE